MAIATPTEGFLTLLKKRHFLRLWLAQLISMTVLQASNYALLVLVEEVTHSTTLIGLAIICFSLPALILGAPAGVFVDRMKKRDVLWISNILRALATFVFVCSLFINRNDLVPIYLLTFIISCIGQFFTPAEGASIPMLVSEEELMPALSLFNITFMLSQALGFILLAPIVLSVLPTFSISRFVVQPIEMLYSIIALLYLFCAILILLIPAEHFKRGLNHSQPTTQPIGVIGNVWSEMFQGWIFIRRQKQLFLSVMQLSFAGVLLLVIGQLATPIVTVLLQLPPSAMAIVFAPAGIGLVVGSVIMPHITRRLGKLRTIFIGTIAIAFIALLLPLSTLLATTFKPLTSSIVALLMFLAGFAIDFINIPAQTAMQKETPDWIKGRVLALQLMLYNAFSIPIIIFIGAVADLFGLDRVLYLLSLCIISFGIWGVYYERRHRGDTQPEERHDLPRLEPDRFTL